MGLLVVSLARIKCSCGDGQAALMPTHANNPAEIRDMDGTTDPPLGRIVPTDSSGLLTSPELPVATIEDYSAVNIPSFGNCNSSGNPLVAAAMAAAGGAPTSGPCTPQVHAAWSGHPTVMADGCRVLTPESTCNCAYGGVISIVDPGQDKAFV